MFKWAQRDKRLAIVMVVDLGLALLVVGVILFQVLSVNQPQQARDARATVIPATPTVANAPLYSLTQSPPLPTVNPTPLVALPNQGQSDAPFPPAGLNLQPTITPNPKS